MTPDSLRPGRPIDMQQPSPGSLNRSPLVLRNEIPRLQECTTPTKETAPLFSGSDKSCHYIMKRGETKRSAQKMAATAFFVLRGLLGECNQQALIDSAVHRQKATGARDGI